MASHPLRAPRVGRRHRRHARRPATTSSTPCCWVWSRTGTSCAASSPLPSRWDGRRSPRRNASARSPPGLAERALGNAFFFRLQQAEAIGLMEQMVAAAAATGAPADPRARLLHVLGGADVDRQSRTGAASSPRSSATPAIESGSPTALAQADYARAISVAADDPARRAGAVRPQRRARRVGREPVDPRLRAHREPVDPGPAGRSAGRAGRLPRRHRHVVPRE